MRIFPWLVFIIGFWIWINSLDGPPPPPPGPIWIKIVLQILGLRDKACKTPAAGLSILINQIDGSCAPLDVKKLVNEHQLTGNDGNVEQTRIKAFDDNIQAALNDCTIFKPDRRRFNETLIDRVVYMASKGFNANDRAYIGAKFRIL